MSLCAPALIAAGLSTGGGYIDNGCRTVWFRNRLPVFAQALDMMPDGQPDLPNSVFPGVPGCDATGKIGNVSGIVLRCFLDNDSVSHLLHSLSRACFRMLAHVPRGTSSPDLWSRCRICRGADTGDDCLGCALTTYPSSSIKRIASRTLGMDRHLCSQFALSCEPNPSSLRSLAWCQTAHLQFAVLAAKLQVASSRP